ncbi:IclR family transcriptional regulator [Sphingosinicella sp.]|uniref:IclR family transcriptional regulator n=1 Tax=Sphingosinicella sp. TaxID=1917971 RepID=UPI0035AE82BC
MTEGSIKSARRVFEVLEYFDRIRMPVSLTQICDQFGYAPSSGSALLKSLVQLGYLEYDKRSRTYLPTMRIALLGSWVATDLFGGLNILRLMEDLRDATGETVVLAARSDLQVQYVHVVHSNEALKFAVAPGTLRPLALSGFGRLLLSAEKNADIEATVRRIDARRAPHEAKINQRALMADLEAVRDEGFATSDSRVTPGVCTMGVLLLPTPFGRRFALGVGGPSVRINSKSTAILGFLRDAASIFEKAVKQASTTDG